MIDAIDHINAIDTIDYINRIAMINPINTFTYDTIDAIDTIDRFSRCLGKEALQNTQDMGCHGALRGEATKYARAVNIVADKGERDGVSDRFG